MTVGKEDQGIKVPIIPPEKIDQSWTNWASLSNPFELVSV
jgi:hypothetical protein